MGSQPCAAVALFLLFVSQSLLVHSLWPAPSSYSSTHQLTLGISPTSFSISVSPSSWVWGKWAADLYAKQILFPFKEVAGSYSYSSTASPNEVEVDGFLKSLRINLTNTQLADLTPGAEAISMDTTSEEYKLVVSEKSTLECGHPIGCLRGLETFSQLILYMPESDLYVVGDTKATFEKACPITIEDRPQYAWRGVMLDTSAHFISPGKILDLIDGMMFNKLNVLHWRITGSESFPLQSESEPQLSQLGSWAPGYDFHIYI
tara:strand:+ start:305 stop:1087 length:783 start_codon:yes stop_codon:yes gene_type:complete